MWLGVPWWLSGLKIQWCHCCGSGPCPGTGTSACHRWGKTKQNNSIQGLFVFPVVSSVDFYLVCLQHRSGWAPVLPLEGSCMPPCFCGGFVYLFVCFGCARCMWRFLARDQTLATAATRAAAVTPPDPYPVLPRRNSRRYCFVCNFFFFFHGFLNFFHYSWCSVTSFAHQWLRTESSKQIHRRRP